MIKTPRSMQVHQGGVGILFRDMNKYSSPCSEVNVRCPDERVYPMLILLMCLAMDHEGTEKHCFKAHNGCLCCDCPWEEYADCSGRPRSQMLVGEIMRKIEEASARLLNRDGSIQQGKIGLVDEWQKKHKIMLHWNNLV